MRDGSRPETAAARHPVNKLTRKSTAIALLHRFQTSSIAHAVPLKIINLKVYSPTL
jgi:hypothetical protein